MPMIGICFRAMTEGTSFLVLAALAEGPQHGYGLIAATGGRMRTGTLYAALDRLRADALIEIDREEIVNSRLRRYYRITGAGALWLTAERARRVPAAVDRVRARPALGEATA
jgi:DNA-binding PadR family transcriptional regulator